MKAVRPILILENMASYFFVLSNNGDGSDGRHSTSERSEGPSKRHARSKISRRFTWI